MSCKKCDLYRGSSVKINGKAVYKNLEGWGNKNADIMLIGEAPNASELIAGMPFVGKTGKLFDNCLKEVGLDRKDLFIDTVIGCKLLLGLKPPKQSINACFGRLDKNIRSVKPKVIGLLGNVACDRILKTSGVTKIHGRPFKSDKYNCWCVPLYNPVSVLRNEGLVEDFIKDLLAIKKLSGNEEVVNRGEYKKYTNYIVVENIEQFKDLIDSVHSEKMFSFDLETFGFDYLKDDIICMAISFKEGNAIVIPFYKNKKEVWNTGERKIILNRLNKLFNSDLIKIAQNIKFDWHFLKTLGIEVKSPYTDTLLMDYLLDENNRGNRSLEDSAFKVNMGFYDKKFKDYRDKHKIGNYFDMPDDMLWEHNASDADCTLRLYNLYNKQIKKENLELLLNKIVLPLTGVLVEMEHCGVGVDMVYADKLKKKLEEKIGSIELELQMLPEVIDYVDDGWKKAIKESTEKYKGSKMLQNKYSLPDYLEKYVPKEKFKFNFKSPKQLKELLFDRLHLEVIRTTEKGNRSTDSKVLETLQYKSIFCKKLLDHRKLTKLYTTYVANLPEMVKSDGKIHSSFNQAITVTGRLSSQSPNLQNIPKGKLGDYIRNYFIAPENSYFIEADYKQLEYRVWAGYSKDEKMLREISSGKDIHRLIAAEVFQISPDKVTKEQRRMAKSVSFGLMYGRSNKAIAREFNMDVEEASNIAKRFFMGYSKASRWLKNVEWFAKEHKYIVNAYGRKRRLPDINSSNIVKKGHAARQAVNFPIQSMASDITSIATIRVFNKLKEFGFKSKIIMTIHDAIVLEVPRDELNKVIKIIRGEMERPISKVDVPLKVDIQVGKRLGLMKGVGDDNV